MRSKALPVSLLILCLATILLGNAPSALAEKDAVPDWVRSAAAQTIPRLPPETRAVVLLDDITYTVAPDGTAIEHRRRAVKILRPAGREDAVAVVRFDKDTRILALHVWSIGPDGHAYSMKDKEIAEVGYPGQGSLYADDRFKIAHAPGADPGGVVAFEVEQRILPYLTEKTWFFQDDIPALHQTFHLDLPPGFTYGTVWAHHAPTKPVDLEHGQLRWDLDETPAIDLSHVPMSPSEGALAGRMTVHYAGPGLPHATDGTWKSIGEWYGSLSRDRLVPTPEITAKATELAGSATDFYSRVEPVAEFVQKQIRYFVIEMGIGGFQPHFAADIYRNRYGDCKDKATLLSAMLEGIGVHSALVMVDDQRGIVDPDAPSIVGDHMILAIEVPHGYTSPRLHSLVTSSSGRTYLIFDPTWEQTAFGQLEHNLQGGYGVLMEGPDSQVIQFPVLSPTLNTVHRAASLQMAPDGSISGNVTETRFGDLSERRRSLYTSGSAKQQADFLDHLLAEDLSSFSVKDVKVENVSLLNQPLTTSFALTAQNFASAAGPLLMLRPRVLGTDGPHPDHQPRVVPINLRETLQIQDDYAIALPPGYAVDELPDPVKLDLDFASYESATALRDNVLHYTRTYTVRQVTLPADRYADVQKLAGVIAADEQSQAILKKR